ncbi:MAG TPA: hypothetical protein VJ576_19580 [Rhodocyclaceae bacterium]|nr:hypothetical protein [Rhodocyclaceae bacterium]
MVIVPFATTAKRRHASNIKLAVELRRLAHDVVRGEIQHVVVTAIRHDGKVQRIGNFPARDF